MKIRFLIDGESNILGVGKFEKGDVRDVDPKTERDFIKNGIAELSSVEKGYKPKKKTEDKVNGDK